MNRFLLPVLCVAAAVSTAAGAQSDIQTAPASDFGLGAVACARVLGPNGLDFTAVEADGWVAATSRGATRVYEKPDVHVRLFVSTVLAQSGQCVVDGYAERGVRFSVIRDGIRDALTANFGEAAVRMPDPPVPNGQAYVIGSLLQILSSEQRPVGLSIRITGMRIS